MRGRDISGQRFGALTAIQRSNQSKNGTWRWLVECDCGKQETVFITVLTNGQKIHCRECWKKDQSTKRSTHGMTGAPEYITWLSMKARCLNEKSPDYSEYGGRGITIDPEWAVSFEAFMRDMGKRPKGKSLDRINNNGPYCKDNCKWSTAKEQANNRRNNIKKEV